MKSNRLSLDEFKRWIKDHKEQPETKIERPHSDNALIGLQVESKADFRKLIHKPECEEDEKRSLAQEFLENGGTIAEVNDKQFVIEVSGGRFSLHRCYVRKI